MNQKQDYKAILIHNGINRDSLPKMCSEKTIENICQDIETNITSTKNIQTSSFLEGICYLLSLYVPNEKKLCNQIQQSLYYFMSQLNILKLEAMKPLNIKENKLWKTTEQWIASFIMDYISKLNTIENLMKQLQANVEDTFRFLSEFTNLALENFYISAIQSKIYSNQNNIFIKKSEGYLDNNIPEIVKDIRAQICKDVWADLYEKELKDKQS